MNRSRIAILVCLVVLRALPATADLLRISDLTTAKIRSLDRSKTVVILSGGMLEEHGPFLPAYTDGILSDRLTGELTRATVASTGLGLRLLLGSQAHLQLDYGHVVQGGPTGRDGSGRLHLRVGLAY